MARRGVALAAALVALTTQVAPGRAKGWSSPAAGPSSTGAPELLFTFDDGPNEPTTGKILDILAKHHVHAIFFMNGWHFETGAVEKSQHLIDRVVREGHIVANHTQTHAQLCTVKDDAKRAWEVDHSHEILERLARMPVLWFRTPYGSYCNRVVDLLAERHLAHFHWDIDPQEWKNKNGDVTAAYIIKRIQHLQDRAVVLMHDTKAATVVALPQVLDWIEAENARRTANGRMPIRILSGADLAVERTAPGLTAWLREAATTSVDDGLALVANALP
ncbi:MAG: polysaccharide deacetylase family protein [Deltaproteobacteria bacterium]|nr:polysaccharide deacetylase family protein [Deltaproteobacteria bacterium]